MFEWLDTFFFAYGGFDLYLHLYKVGDLIKASLSVYSNEKTAPPYKWVITLRSTSGNIGKIVFEKSERVRCLFGTIRYVYHSVPLELSAPQYIQIQNIAAEPIWNE